MPNPKRRHSKTRTAKRRTHDALKPVGRSECPQCHEAKTAASRLSALRSLSRPSGDGGRRGITISFELPGLSPEARLTAERGLTSDVRIAIDAMGRRRGPAAVVDGALVAARHLQVGLLLVGDAARLTPNSRVIPAARGLDRRGRGHRRSGSRWQSRRGGVPPQAEGVDSRRGRSGPRWAAQARSSARDTPVHR